MTPGGKPFQTAKPMVWPNEMPLNNNTAKVMAPAESKPAKSQT